MAAKALTLAELRERLASKAKPQPVPTVQPEVNPEPPIEPKVAPPKAVKPEAKTKAPKQPEPKRETKPDAQTETREAWLERASNFLCIRFASLHKIFVPEFRVSVGFSRDTRSKRLIGQTVPAEKTADSKPQVFITPMAETSTDALNVLAFQMATVVAQRAAVSPAAIALRMGMIVNPDQSKTAPPFIAGDALSSFYATIFASLNSYPHSAVLPTESKPGRAMPLVHCVVSGPKGYKLRMSQVWLNKFGTPICPCHNKIMKVEA